MRNGLAAVAAVVAFYGAVFVPVVAAVLVMPTEWWEGQAGLVVQTGALVVGSVAASALVVGIGWANLEMLGFREMRKSLKGFGFGLCIGLLMACGAVAVAVLAGNARVTLEGGSAGSFLASATGVGVVLLLAALAEELMFRGYPITVLAQAFGKLQASLALATLFVLAHVFNPDASAFGLVNIGLAALLLSAAFFGPGGIAAAWGLHVGWNGGLGICVDAPVSGVSFGLPAVEYSVGGPAWLTGGSFGPEGGLVTTIAMTTVLVWLLRNRETSERTI